MFAMTSLCLDEDRFLTMRLNFPKTKGETILKWNLEQIIVLAQTVKFLLDSTIISMTFILNIA
jgi:hypothetical protein